MKCIINNTNNKNFLRIFAKINFEVLTLFSEEYIFIFTVAKHSDASQKQQTLRKKSFFDSSGKETKHTYIFFMFYVKNKPVSSNLNSIVNQFSK